MEISREVENERIKLTASFLNNIGVSVFVVGVVAPWLADVFGDGPKGLIWFVSAGAGFLGALFLHVIGRNVLGHIKQESWGDLEARDAHPSGTAWRAS
jgi:hypothetical protein